MPLTVSRPSVSSDQDKLFPKLPLFVTVPMASTGVDASSVKSSGSPSGSASLSAWEDASGDSSGTSSGLSSA